jgi:transcriptional regulator with XRE-family HTH domain
MRPEENSFWKLVGGTIAEERDRLGWTQEELGIAADLHRASVCNIEAGRQRTSVYRLRVLASVLGVPMAKLMPEAEIPVEQERRIGVIRDRLEARKTRLETELDLVETEIDKLGE